MESYSHKYQLHRRVCFSKTSSAQAAEHISQKNKYIKIKSTLLFYPKTCFNFQTESCRTYFIQEKNVRERESHTLFHRRYIEVEAAAEVA